MRPDEKIISNAKEVNKQSLDISLAEILSNTDKRKEFLKDLTASSIKRPPTHSKASNSPYYKERFALEMKCVLDEMMIDNHPRTYKYSQHSHLSTNSVYLYVNSSLKYVLDNLDSDGKYKQFRERLVINRVAKVGVVLSILRESSFKPCKTTNNATEHKWINQMNEWLENGKINTKFVAKNIIITPERRFELEATLAPLENIHYNISDDEITIRKFNPIPD